MTSTRRAHGRPAASSRPAPSHLHTPDEVAAELRVAVKTLTNWRYHDLNMPPHKRRGPDWITLRTGRIRYERAAIDAYLGR